MKRDEEKARIDVEYYFNDQINNHTGHILCDIRDVFDNYYLSANFFREFKEFFKLANNKLNMYSVDGFEGITYKRIKHNLKELRKANIGVEVINCEIEY